MTRAFLNEKDPKTVEYFESLSSEIQNGMKMSGLKFMNIDEIDVFINNFNDYYSHE